MNIKIANEIDDQGFYIGDVVSEDDPIKIEQALYDYIIEEDGTETKVLKPNLVLEDVPENSGFHSPKRDLANGVWVEGKPAEDLLNLKRQSKISELYAAYQSAKLGDVTSSLLGSDGQPIVFSYEVKNQDDYKGIIASFAIDPNQLESIIGSKSHGKFFITRDETIVLKEDFRNHETNLYIKFKDLKTQAETATDTELDTIVWT